jgi:hypothetical protein
MRAALKPALPPGKSLLNVTVLVSAADDEADIFAFGLRWWFTQRICGALPEK